MKNIKKVLITGGPVYGKLDDVKLVTNKFKGGLIAKLADELSELGKDNISITYLVAKGFAEPNSPNIKIIYQDGYYDYKDKVLELAPEMDAVILGSAVANLIPKEPFKGKFPSHNYEPGEVINIPFIIAPRIIDMIKIISPKTAVFGFKLLSGYNHEQLIEAGYEVVLNSKATAVFANDTKDLTKKYAITKERSIIELNMETYPDFIWEALNDKHYSTMHSSTTCYKEDEAISTKEVVGKFEFYKEKYKEKFEKIYGGKYKFGTIAVRIDNEMFFTTARGKRELEETVVVKDVDHNLKKVIVYGIKKASLNAPLLANIFKNPKIDVIVHYHEEDNNYPTLPYAFPGTVRDSVRNITGSFNIENHGCFLLFDKEGNLITEMEGK
ncbi:MAG: hypothetical protein K0R54_1834 [Clostridiaceae bacterium]|jgi:hypothetical protein|nr:hypothetical protein [Clostridiaceae bacterium]